MAAAYPAAGSGGTASTMTSMSSASRRWGVTRVVGHPFINRRLGLLVGAEERPPAFRTSAAGPIHRPSRRIDRPHIFGLGVRVRHTLDAEPDAAVLKLFGSGPVGDGGRPSCSNVTGHPSFAVNASRRIFARWSIAWCRRAEPS